MAVTWPASSSSPCWSSSPRLPARRPGRGKCCLRSPRAAATLVSAAAAVAPGPVELGLRLRLAPGWHTLLANPGDAGAPARGDDPLAARGRGRRRSAGRRPAHPDRPAGQLRLRGGGGAALPGGGAGRPCPGGPADHRGRGDLAGSAPSSASRRRGASASTSRSPRPPAPMPPSPRCSPPPRRRRPAPSPWAARAALAAPRGSLIWRARGFPPRCATPSFPRGGRVADNAAPQPLTLRDGSLTLVLTRRRAAATPDAVRRRRADRRRRGAAPAYAVAAPVGGAPATGGEQLSLVAGAAVRPCWAG